MKTKIASLIALLLLACGSPQQTARAVVNSGGIALNEVDVVAAQGYTQAAQDALEAAQSMEEYEAAMQVWNKLEEVLRAVQGSLLVAENIVDAWDAGSQDRFLDVLSEMVSGFRLALAILVQLDVPVPQELLDFLQLVGQAFGEGVE